MKRRLIVAIASLLVVLCMNAYVCFATDYTEDGGPSGTRELKASHTLDLVWVKIPYKVTKTKYRTQPGGGRELLGYLRATVSPAYVSKSASMVPKVFTISASVVPDSWQIYTNQTTSLTVSVEVDVKKTWIFNIAESTDRRKASETFVP